MANKFLAKTSGEKEPGMLSKLVKYLRSVKGEFKKVIWPTRKQLFNNTGVVIATIIVSGVCIGILDFILKVGVDTLLQRV